MKFLLISILFLTTISSKTLGQNLQDKRIIFPADQKLPHLYEDSPGARFTLTNAEADSVDTYLRQYFQNKSPQQAKGLELDSYYRQYIGYVTNGERIVYVIASCRKTDLISYDIIWVMGGGTCYFHVQVNLQSKEVVNFYFNAPR